jgi:predicted permease
LAFSEDLAADLRYGLRLLRRDRIVTAVAVLSMALAIGANTALFSVAKDVLFQKLGVSQPEQLRLLRWQFSGPRQPIPSIFGEFSQTPSGGFTSTSFSYPVYQRLTAKTDAFNGLTAFAQAHALTAIIDKEAAVVGAQVVSGNFFQVLGASTILGRPIVPSDAQENSPAVAVLSYDLWVRRFAQSPDVLGKVITLNAVPVTVIGVLSRSSLGPQLGGGSNLFLPVNLKPRVDRNFDGDQMRNGRSWWLLLLGRLKPGVSDARAEAALNPVLQQAAADTLPNHGGRADLHTLSLHVASPSASEHLLRSHLAGPVSILFSLVALLLLLACTNVASLLVAKSAVRTREMSVRKTLGAGRWRIVRQMLTESLLLASLAGTTGLLLAFALRRLLPYFLDLPQPPAFDLGVLAFTLALTLATGLLFGLAPALQMFREQPAVAFNESSRLTSSRSKARLRQSLVVFEMALSTLLLLAAVLFVRTLANLLSAPLGFEPARLLLFEARPSPGRYVGGARFSLYQRLEERLAALPGVRSVALVNDVLISNSSDGSNFDPDSQPYRDGRMSLKNNVSSAFFETVGIPIRRGRPFDKRDSANSPKVAIVNEQLVHIFFPHSDPLGQTFNNGIKIVGVAADSLYSSLRKAPAPTFYQPYFQTEERGNLTFYLKTAADPIKLASTVRKTVTAIDPEIPILNFRTQEEEIHSSLSQERLFATLTSVFGVLALLLSSIGIYGVMRHSVTRRTNEVGVRLALGAQSGQILRLLLSEGLLLAVAGLAAGLLISVFLTSYVRSFFYAVTPSDPLSLTLAALILLTSAALAVWLPARHAARITPVEALRHQ